MHYSNDFRYIAFSEFQSRLLSIFEKKMWILFDQCG